MWVLQLRFSVSKLIRKPAVSHGRIREIYRFRAENVTNWEIDRAAILWRVSREEKQKNDLYDHSCAGGHKGLRTGMG